MSIARLNIFPKRVLLYERTSTVLGGEKFRYGFNNMEADDEVKGDGNSYTTEFRQYDPRLGRWLSIDPSYAKFPWQSPYTAFDNKPICLNDPKGAASEVANGDGNKKLTQNKNGTRSASNGDGTTTYDAPGFSQVTIPERAKITGAFTDVDGNGKINLGSKTVQASEGDIYTFEVDKVTYSATFNDGGAFAGFKDKSGNSFKLNSNGKSSSAGSDLKVNLYAEIETGVVENSYGANLTKGWGGKVKLGEQVIGGIHSDSDKGTYLIGKDNTTTKLGAEVGWYSFGVEYNYVVNPDFTTSHQGGFTFLSFGRIEYEHSSNGKQSVFIGINPSASASSGIGVYIGGKFGLQLNF